jgi:hypothetical protein
MILAQDNEYAAVLDACVLVPMPLCDTLLRLAEDPQCTDHCGVKPSSQRSLLC